MRIEPRDGDAKDPLDCMIVGAGPAGLTAAIYLARFRLPVAIIDAGASRAAMIPRTRNHAGFPGGISGRALVNRMRRQAAEFGVSVTEERVERLELADGLFRVHGSTSEWTARSVLLATGVVNRRPPMDERLHDRAVRDGRLRYCPICDGFEVTDRRVAVIGTKTHGHNEALFLRGFTRDVTLIAPEGQHLLSADEKAKLTEAGVTLRDGPCRPLRLEGDQIAVPTGADTLWFDTVYPALGSDIRSELAVALGADASPDGCLLVDGHQRTSIDNLYAAGDVVKGLDQISHAMGEGGVAATTIRNDLARRRSLYR